MRRSSSGAYEARKARLCGGDGADSAGQWGLTGALWSASRLSGRADDDTGHAMTSVRISTTN